MCFQRGDGREQAKSGSVPEHNDQETDRSIYSIHPLYPLILCMVAGTIACPRIHWVCNIPLYEGETVTGEEMVEIVPVCFDTHTGLSVGVLGVCLHYIYGC